MNKKKWTSQYLVHESEYIHDGEIKKNDSEIHSAKKLKRRIERKRIADKR